MKKILVIVCVFCFTGFGFGQACVPTATQACTPNINLALPSLNTPLWNVPVNQNSNWLDSLLGGVSTGKAVSFANVSSLDNILFVDGVKYTTAQQAINALPSTGGTVVLPCGTFTMSDQVLNISNLVVTGAGTCTNVLPSGGSGHYAFVLGNANPSSAQALQLRNLSITCPGGGDLTSGVLVRKGVARGVYLDSLKVRQCAQGIVWGETTGPAVGAFDGHINNFDDVLVGTQIGVHISNGSNGANGITIDHASIRNEVLDTGISTGILIEGQADRIVIINSYIEDMPGGDIVLRTTNGAVDKTTIMNNYFEPFGVTGVVLDIGAAVANTVFMNNYTNAATSPSNYTIKIADTATGTLLANNTFQNEGIAVINNLNTNIGAGIYWENNTTTSAIYDSAVGIVQHNHLGGFPYVVDNVADNSFRIQNTNVGGSGLKLIPGADTTYGVAVTNAAGNTINYSVLGNGTITTNGPFQFAGKSLFLPTAPTISSGFGTSPSVVFSNGSAVFELNVGTGGSATSGVIGLPTATNGWGCLVRDMNTDISTRQSAFTASSVTITAASAWTASDKLIVQCEAF